MQFRFLPLILVSLLCSTAVLAQNKDAVAFGARQAVQQVSLSPDGQRVAVVVPVDARATTAVVIELTGDQKKTVVLRANGDPDRIQRCDWASDVRLVCDIYGVTSNSKSLVGSSKLIAISADGTNPRLVTARNSSLARVGVFNGGDIVDLQAPSKEVGNILVTRYVAPEQSTGTLLAQRKSGFGVEQVDVNGTARKMVEQPGENAFSYISDGQGNVRIMGTTQKTDDGLDKNINRYFYRMAGESKWLPLSTETIEGGVSIGFTPIAVDPRLNVVYGLEGRQGRSVLTSIALDGSMRRELVYDQGKVDVDDVLMIGRQKRVIGATFATETRQAQIFDPAIKKLADALAKALPNLPQIQIVDASADETVLLMWAGSDVDPGRYLIYNKKTGQLGELLGVRPPLASKALAKVTPITFSAGDGVQIPGYLTMPAGSNSKNLPLIVMPHGGPSSRDEWGFDWLPQYFVARGYAVLQPNFRGSTGYGVGWFERNGFQSWRKAIGDVNDAARWAIAQGITSKDKVAIIGWSYGGYAALQSAVAEPGLFKAVIAVAPVTDLDAYRREATDFSYFNLRDDYVGHGPHIDEGSPARHADAIQVPVLMFHGDQDINVGIGESRLMRDRLRGAGKSVDLVEFKGLDHQLEDDNARAQMLDRSDNFLRTALHLP